MRNTVFLLGVTASVIECLAQAPNPHLETARRIAGTQWAPAYEFFCVAPHANAATDPPIEPTKIFDNLYAIGDSGTTAYALTTREGIILIDALPANQTESVLLPGMKALGLDPAAVKYVIVTHGHGDHSGGSGYFQEHYGSRVALSAEDWDLLLQANTKGGGKEGDAKKATVNTPHRDVVMTDGMPITLGGASVTPVLTPGHTPGAMGLIFAVNDGSTPHTAALFGGTILLPARPPVSTLKTYLTSIAHFKEATAKARVDVELQNHPLMDGFVAKLTAVRERKPGTPHPFVVGTQNYGKFLDVMTECMRAQRPEVP